MGAVAGGNPENGGKKILDNGWELNRYSQKGKL